MWNIIFFFEFDKYLMDHTWRKFQCGQAILFQRLKMLRPCRNTLVILCHIVITYPLFGMSWDCIINFLLKKYFYEIFCAVANFTKTCQKKIRKSDLKLIPRKPLSREDFHRRVKMDKSKKFYADDEDFTQIKDKSRKA